MIKELQKLVIESDDKQIQTDVKPLVDCQSQTDLDSETLLEYLYQFNDEDKVYIISKGWSSIEDQNKLVIVYDLINKMEHEMQCDLYTLLGNSFNEILLKYTKEHHMDFNHMTIQNLTKISKGEIYNKFDERLVSFFDAATCKTSNHTSRKTHNNLNEKSNIVESMLKARNHNCVTASGMTENIICHFASNKSKATGNVLSKLGAKGSKYTLDIVLQNSVVKSLFNPEHHIKKSLMLSYDNIQTLLKSHVIANSDKGVTLAIVVTSVCASQIDGGKSSDMQYKIEHAPEFWNRKYQYHNVNDVLINVLDSEVLKEISVVKESDQKVVHGYFEAYLIFEAY